MSIYKDIKLVRSIFEWDMRDEEENSYLDKAGQAFERIVKELKDCQAEVKVPGPVPTEEK